MGFRMNMGATMSCRLRDSYLEVDWPSNIKYKTDLPSDLNIDWQCNIFESPVVYFVLSYNKELYIGTLDGSIIVCGYDGLLKKLYTWKSPGVIDPPVVGYYQDLKGQIYEAVISMSVPRLVMVKGLRRSYILNEGLDALTFDPFETSYTTKLAISLHDALGTSNAKLGLTLRGGVPFNEEEHGRWEVDSYIAVNDAIQF